jgi:hypothetical protein
LHFFEINVENSFGEHNFLPIDIRAKLEKFDVLKLNQPNKLVTSEINFEQILRRFFEKIASFHIIKMIIL